MQKRTDAFILPGSHPIYLGFLVHTRRDDRPPAVFARTTGYIFVGIMLEERDLLHFHGEQYAHYRQQVSMILPVPLRKSGGNVAMAKKQARGN